MIHSWKKQLAESAGAVQFRALKARQGSRGAGSQALPADRPVDGGAGFFVGQVRSMSRTQRRAMIDRDLPEVSVVRAVRVAVHQPLIGALPPG